jgi:ribosomal protein S18 acetylase RimI-like enzyme
LQLLALEDADFDLEGRGEPLVPLEPAQATRYLSNPSVLHWVAFDDSGVTGFLYCSVVYLRSAPGQELLLYEIGVRQRVRRQGVGRALLTHMENWMRDSGLTEVWVLADNQVAVDFYRGCGFAQELEQPVYLTREIERSPKKAAATLLSFR